MNLEVLYNDRHVLAVNKPARCPVAKDSSDDDTLLDSVRSWNGARQESGRKGYCVPIHFLDRPVSGVILFALSSKAASRLNAQFRGRQVRKTYWAVVCGRPDLASATCEDWVAKDEVNNLSRVVRPGDSDGKLCRLSYRVIPGAKPGLTLLEVMPETGRSHQIRVQLAALGCPIWGDVKYGAPETWGGRIALHAREISFQHPVGQEKQVMGAPVPEYWQDVLNLPMANHTEE